MTSLTIREMIAELEAAGWKRWKGHHCIWQSPWGALFRGPAKAWEVMSLVNALQL